MGLSVILRPTGYVLEANQNTDTAFVSNNSGDALFSNNNNHGMSTGDIIYVHTPVEQYNGFKRIEINGLSQFYIKNLNSGNKIDYVRSLEQSYLHPFFYYYETKVGHGWSSVHLPIVYELQSDVFPVNGVDTARTMTVTNSNGYCAIVASGDIKTGGSAIALDFLKITTAAGTYDGIYQIISYTSDTQFTIDLAYSAATETSLELGTSFIQYYLKNYCAFINLYAGIESINNIFELTDFSNLKPFTLVSTLKIIPDENNIIRFSVNDILKSKITVDNNLTLGSLPNNINAFTKFYITYSESFNVSDGIDVSTYIGSATSDENADLYAVNSKLPFKNIYSGFMSEYLMDLFTTGKFLTLFENPVVFKDQYFDISAIIGIRNSVYIRKQYYLNDALQATTNTAIDEFQEGVYRLEIEQDDDYDRVDISLYSFTYTNEINFGLAWGIADLYSYINLTDGAGGSHAASDFLVFPVNGLTSYDYLVSVTGTITGSLNINFLLYDNATLLDIVVQTLSVGDNVNTFLLFGANPTAIKIYLELDNGNVGVRVKGIRPTDPVIPHTLLISEVKTLLFDNKCSNQSISLTWLNYLGGFDYWTFTGQKEYDIDVLESDTLKMNLLPSWPDSSGEFADTVEKETFRDSKQAIVITSQFVSADQIDAMKYIRTSSLVQIINDRYDRRTVIVDKDSFKVSSDGDKLYSMSFRVSYTDDIPSQTL